MLSSKPNGRVTAGLSPNQRVNNRGGAYGLVSVSQLLSLIFLYMDMQKDKHGIFKLVSLFFFKILFIFRER